MTPHTCPWLPHSTCSCDLWLSHKHGFHFDGKLLLHHKIFVCRVQNYSLWFSILILLLFEFFYFFSYTNFKHRQNIFYILPDNCSPKYDKAYWIWLTLTYFQGHSCPSLSLGRRGCLSFSERLVHLVRKRGNSRDLAPFFFCVESTKRTKCEIGLNFKKGWIFLVWGTFLSHFLELQIFMKFHENLRKIVFLDIYTNVTIE